MKAAAARTVFVCQECGAQSSRWVGRCPACGGWNTCVEELAPAPGGSRARLRLVGGSSSPLPLAGVQFAPTNRLRLAQQELNQVLGGGIVPGSLVLISGDPGIGKSTLLLQLSQEVATTFGPVLYISGEESVQQIKLRADRLGIAGDRLLVLAENDLDRIIDQVEQVRPQLAVVDSIQTVFLNEVASAPGSVGQVRECANRLMVLAKTAQVPVFVVGHVNKEGAIAGPRVLEHIVDAVLYLEGERHHAFRILRAQKNRFGSTDEIGIFEMRDDGMREVPDAGRAFLHEGSNPSVGSVVTVALEGTRPLLVELQGLVTESSGGLPRRAANGIDLTRLHLLVAVLEKRARLPLGRQDIYVNVAGGARLAEPAVDLAVALAIASTCRDRPVVPGLLAVGELGLAGEVRRVPHLERRLHEGHRLGFRAAIIPADRQPATLPGLRLHPVATLADAIAAGLGS